MCESTPHCPQARREGFSLESRHLRSLVSKEGSLSPSTEIHVGYEHQFYPSQLAVDFYTGMDFLNEGLGAHGGLRINHLWRLPANFLLGPIAENQIHYVDSKLSWRGMGGAEAAFEPNSWLQVFVSAGGSNTGWIGAVGVNLIFAPQKQINPPSRSRRRNTEQILRDILRQVEHPNLSAYRVCHNMKKITAEPNSPILKYAMDSAAYDRSLHGVHESQIHIEQSNKTASSYGESGEILAVKKLTLLGNADEEKDGFVPAVVSIVSAPEEKFGNLSISVSPVDSPQEECPAWSPPRPVVTYQEDPLLCLLSELSEWREPRDAETMHFPKKTGEAGYPEAFRILPGPYQSHPPLHVPADTPNQCEWGAKQWQEVEYMPPLKIANLSATPGVQQTPYLCIRLMENEGPFADQALLQFALSVNDLRTHHQAWLAVDAEQETHVLFQWGKDGESLASHSPLVLGLELSTLPPPTK